MHDKNILKKLKIKQAVTLDKIKKTHLYFQKKSLKVFLTYQFILLRQEIPLAIYILTI